MIRNLIVMTAHFPPASGHGEHGIPRPRSGRYGALTSEVSSGARVRPGESDPARMLSAVLLLVLITLVTMVTLVWWLA